MVRNSSRNLNPESLLLLVKMQDVTLKVPGSMYRLVSDLFETKEEMIRDFLYSIALAKVLDYRKREQIYEGKHRQRFKEFEKRILDKSRGEIFEEWDDYITWKAVHEAHELWNRKYKKLEKCSI